MFFGVLTFSTFVGIVFVLWQGGLLVLDGAAHPGRAGPVPPLHHHHRGGHRRAGLVLQQLPGGGRRGGAGLRDSGDAAGHRRPGVPGAAALAAPGRVAFEGVFFRYQHDQSLPWILEGIRSRCAPGEVVALVGPSGGGKTTLVSLLPRFWDVDRGRVLLDGIDVRDLRLADLRGAIGIVPQDPALFSGTIRENIAYARPGASDDGGGGGGAGGPCPRVHRAAAAGI